jgi:hypothetical protein
MVIVENISNNIGASTLRIVSREFNIVYSRIHEYSENYTELVENKIQ